MRITRKVISIMLVTLLLLSIGIDITVRAIELVDNNKQITGLGGINSTNTIGTQDGVTVSKTISATNIENYFDITLKVNTTKKIEEIVKAQDLVVVLVLDISNTMNSIIDGSETTENPNGLSRMEVAKDAAQNFINNFYKYSNTEETKDVVREIGFVTFNKSAQTIFNLSPCKTETQRDSLNDKIETIIAPSTQSEKWTNMEAGLSAAKEILDTSSVTNKYIVFLTDGLPTTYSQTKEGTIGYYPGSSQLINPLTPTEGFFYNFEKNVAVPDGTNYSDLGARRAEELSTKIKNEKIKIFSIGVAISNQHSMYRLIHFENSRYASTVDTDTEENNYAYYKDRYYAILPGVNQPSSKIDEDPNVRAMYESQDYYKTWLQNYIASGSGFYYDSDNKSAIDNAYNSIFAGIKQMTEETAQATWVAEDPMGTYGETKNIQFIGLYDDNKKLHESLDSAIENQSDTASFINNKISWDLKKSSYDTHTENNITHYTYEIKYRIRLENELSNFKINTNYETNGKTTLTYIVRNNGVLSENKYIDFPIPSVTGYLGELSFNKISSFDGKNLSGAAFELVHANDCPCKNEHKFPTINTVSKVSENNTGLVLFTNIPSGHKYILKETIPPKNYIKNEKEYTVIVSYGETKVYQNGVEIENFNKVYNEIQKGNLTIKKMVESEEETKNKKFKFKIEVINDKTGINGNFKYKLNNIAEEKNIIFTNGIAEIELKHNDTITISGLPYSATYKITELEIEGYSVEYCINSNTSCLESNNIQIGNIAESQIEIGDNNKVEFINITSFILPDTGNSGGLILLIIGSLLIIVPVIYIISMLCKKRKEGELTS